MPWYPGTLKTMKNIKKPGETTKNRRWGGVGKIRSALLWEINYESTDHPLAGSPAGDPEMFQGCPRGSGDVPGMFPTRFLFQFRFRFFDECFDLFVCLSIVWEGRIFLILNGKVIS